MGISHNCVCTCNINVSSVYYAVVAMCYILDPFIRPPINFTSSFSLDVLSRLTKPKGECYKQPCFKYHNNLSQHVQVHRRTLSSSKNVRDIKWWVQYGDRKILCTKSWPRDLDFENWLRCNHRRARYSIHSFRYLRTIFMVESMLSWDLCMWLLRVTGLI